MKTESCLNQTSNILSELNFSPKWDPVAFPKKGDHYGNLGFISKR